MSLFTDGYTYRIELNGAFLQRTPTGDVNISAYTADKGQLVRERYIYNALLTLYFQWTFTYLQPSGYYDIANVAVPQKKLLMEPRLGTTPQTWNVRLRQKLPSGMEWDIKNLPIQNTYRSDYVCLFTTCFT